jgi:hypothetical protein
MLDPASCEAGGKRPYDDTPKPRVVLKLRPDGLLHGPDGRRWSADGSTEVNGVNNYVQLDSNREIEEPVQQHAQIDVETLEEKADRAAEVRKAEAASLAHEEAREQTRQQALS